jgi:hypothetical protein
MHLPYAN